MSSSSRNNSAQKQFAKIAPSALKAKQNKNRASNIKKQGPNPSGGVAVAYSMRNKGNNNPSVNGRKSLSVRYANTEFVTDLLANSTGAFLLALNQGLNPGNSVLFPWLSRQAIGFDTYRFQKCVLHYNSMAPSSSAGCTILSFDPNAGDAVPGSKQEALDNVAAIRDDVWKPISLVLPMQDLNALGPDKFIRLGAVPAGADVKTFDSGTVYHAYSSTGSATNLGDLTIEYVVDLISPQNNLSAIASAYSIDISTPATATRAAPFTGGVQTSIGNLPATASGATITFNRPGQFLVTIALVGTAFTDTAPTLTGTATANNILVSVNGMMHTTAATEAEHSFRVNVLAAGQTVILDYTASATTITTSAVRIAQYAVANL